MHVIARVAPGQDSGSQNLSSEELTPLMREIFGSSGKLLSYDLPCNQANCQFIRTYKDFTLEAYESSLPLPFCSEARRWFGNRCFVSVMLMHDANGTSAASFRHTRRSASQLCL